MSLERAPLTDRAKDSVAPKASGFLQRQCACGQHTPSQCSCDACEKKEWESNRLHPLQAKLTVSQPDDIYEKEADRIADRVMRVSDADDNNQAGYNDNLVRDAHAMPNIQRIGMGTQKADQNVPPIDHNVVRSPGRALDQATRDYMEPRFGYDFSRVRVHEDASASASARAIDASAYTMGSNVVFGSGQYRPQTNAGRRLLAHELTHVIQQEAATKRTGRPIEKIPDSSRPIAESTSQTMSSEPSLYSVSCQPHTHPSGDNSMIQRMSYGRGDPPWQDHGLGLVEVPQGDRERVNGAIGRIREVVDDPDGFDDCHGVFTERCTNGSPDSMQTTFNNAVLWKMTQPSGDELARGDVNGPIIAYSQNGYDRGEFNLAKTLVHEMMHNCGITGGDDHDLAAVAGLYCIGAGLNIISVGLGGGTDVPIIDMVSYRRILSAWASGRIELTTGFDVNVTGLAFEGASAATGADRRPSEFAAATVGVRGRSNILWGGERFGGLTGSIDTGIGVGRFALQSPDPAESSTAVAGDLVLRVGAGAEFYIPIGAHALPVSIEAAYRLAQPMNGEARRIHSFVLSVGKRF